MDEGHEMAIQKKEMKMNIKLMKNTLNLPTKQMQIKMRHHIFFTIKIINIKRDDNTQCW